MSRARPGDVVVIALAALLVGASWASLWRGAGPAEWVLVTAPGMEARRVAIGEDATLEINGRLGISRIELRDGRVRFVDSPCVGRLCVHAGWLSRSGHVAACLPNGVVVEVRGGEREFDAVSF